MAKFILHNRQALGDIVTLTALARDLNLAGHEVRVSTTFHEAWMYNPHVSFAGSTQPGWTKVKCGYGQQIRKAKVEKLHFIKAWYENFAHQTGVVVQPSRSKPDLYLHERDFDAIQLFKLPKRYWVVISGGKWDFTTKHPVTSYVQQVSDTLRAAGIPTVQLGAMPQTKKFWQPVISGAINLLGRTDVRQMMAVISQADGVLCTITSAMHIAAAFDRPCVVWAGGREEPWWESYSNDWRAFGPHAEPVQMEHRYLHTAGLLSCCPLERPGCWKSKTVREGGKETVCKMPVTLETQSVPKCQTLITPDKVVASVFSYYLSGKLPPIEGAMVPAVDQPVSLLLPDGKAATIQVVLPVIDLPGGINAIPEGQVPNANGFRVREAEEVKRDVGNAKRIGVPPKGTIQNIPNRGVEIGKRGTVQPGLHPVTPPDAVVVPKSYAKFRHPAVGGHFTVFVLMYGNYFDMHKRCLDGILNSQYIELVDLRILGNELGSQSRAYIQEKLHEGRIRTFYDNHENRKKYPVMREVFRDPDVPIETKWIIWFDDDSIVENPAVDWLGSLADVMIARSTSNVGMIGRPLYYPNHPSQLQFIRSAPWYKNKLFRDRNGKASPNGRFTHFVGGYLWAMKTECILKCDIPDLRLGHNGGDVLIGEQLYQAGYSIAGWNQRREFVNFSSVPRRGLSEPHYGRS